MSNRPGGGQDNFLRLLPIGLARLTYLTKMAGGWEVNQKHPRLNASLACLLSLPPIVPHKGENLSQQASTFKTNCDQGYLVSEHGWATVGDSTPQSHGNRNGLQRDSGLTAEVWGSRVRLSAA